MNTPDFPTPAAAEAAFYEAFEKARIEDMMAVWAGDDDIACVHPMGVMHRGQDAVRDSWKDIFRGSGRMHFQIESSQQNLNGDLSVHVVTEHIFLHGESNPRPPIVSTNIYRRTSDGWRMVLHHASPSVVKTRAQHQAGEQEPRQVH